MSDFDLWITLVGRWVTVRLTDDLNPVTVTGDLVKLDDGGQCVIRDEAGFNHYCWPALEIVQACVDGLPAHPNA